MRTRLALAVWLFSPIVSTPALAGLPQWFLQSEIWTLSAPNLRENWHGYTYFCYWQNGDATHWAGIKFRQDQLVMDLGYGALGGPPWTADDTTICQGGVPEEPTPVPYDGPCGLCH